MDHLSQGEEQAARVRQGLCDFIQSHRVQILQAWERQIRALPVASTLSNPRLLDHLPDLLDHITQVMCAAPAHEDSASRDSPELHALQRLDSGFDVGMVATEYAMLRECILELYGQQEAADVAPPPDLPASHEVLMREVQRFNVAIDQVIVVAMNRYARARERTLSALDRISSAALQSNNAEQFMPKLLQVLRETTEAVDSVAVFLREGDRFHLRAAVGTMEPDVAAGFSLALGEGFVGWIGAWKTPLELRSASTDPLVLSETIRSQGLRALYGVPMMEGDEVIGVAHMGSRTAHQFSEEDKLFFRVMTTRATALLVQAQLVARERAARQEAQRAQEELQRTAQFREQFLGILGHDLRNPLNAILLSAHALLRSEQAPPATLSAAGRIVSSAQRMVGMINELMDFARGRLGGGIPVTRREGDLFAILRQAVEELQAAHPDRAIHFQLAGEGHGQWDDSRMAQVLVNLGMNALQHSPAHSPITVSARGEPERVVLTVHNPGPPIPPEVLPELFHPFRRGLSPEQRARGAPGLGLGLYIVRQIILAHGGSVTVASTPPEGTTFTVALPRHPPRPAS